MSPEQKINKLQELLAGVSAENKGVTSLKALFDADTFVELDTLVATSDAVTGYGTVDGTMVYAWAQNETGITEESAQKIKRVYELAVKNGCPVVAMFDSKGANVAQGAKMLTAYSDILCASNNLSGVVPQIAVVLGTCAGLSSMIAGSADFVIMSEKAELFLTAPFIAKANGKSATGAGTAKNAAQNGLASIVCADSEKAIEAAKKVLSLLPANNLSTAPLFEFEENAADLQAIALDIENAQTEEIVKAVIDADNAVEISAEYGIGATTTLATAGGSVVGVVATSKKAELGADACAKIAKFVNICDAFNVPVVTIIDTKGFENTSCPCLVRNAVALAGAYAESTTAKINLIVGNAIGSAYMTLAGTNSNADVTFAWPTAVISALAPETAVEFMWADRFEGTKNADQTRAELVEEYIDTVASPFEVAKQGLITNVIDPASTRNVVLSALDMLSSKRVTKLPKKHNNV